MTPVGGYARGKELSGDVDIVVYHSEEERAKTLLDDIMESLQKRGLIAGIMNTTRLSIDSNEHSLHTHGKSHFDRLAKCFFAFNAPSIGVRQVDIIVSPWSVRHCAIIGWTGSKMFERSIRSWCKDKKNWTFTSHGLYERNTGEPIEVKSEKGFFEMLGIPYFDPTLRNA